MKILTILGARPQFIKAAPVSNELFKNNINEVLVNTGQHYDFNMSDIFFKELNIRPAKYDLKVGSSSHGIQTGSILKKLDAIFEIEKPDIVIVYGDTNSTLAGAIGAAKYNIPIAHIEAGLRSFNRNMPEEINRIITDNLSSFLLCPSNISKENLLKEGITKGVHIVGDVMFDIFKKNEKYFSDNSKFNDYCLLTLHRAENTNESSLKNRINQIKSLDMKVVFPMHPRTKKCIDSYKIILPKNIHVINPKSWLEMMNLVKNSKFVITDSGGLQKEAFWHNKFCYTLRSETEWIETIGLGMNCLVNLNDNINLDLINTSNQINPYGNGKTSEKLVSLIVNSK